MLVTFIILLVILQLKHFAIECILQSDTGYNNKNDFTSFGAIIHSIQHGLLTALCVILVLPENYIFAIIAGLVDMVLHHIIDFCKTRIFTKEGKVPENRYIWGVDNFFHQLTYLGIAAGIIAL